MEPRILLPQDYTIVSDFTLDTIRERIRAFSSEWEPRLPTLYREALMLPSILASPETEADTLEHLLRDAEERIILITRAERHEEASTLLMRLFRQIDGIILNADRLAARLALQGGTSYPSEAIRLLKRAYDLPRSLLPFYATTFQPFPGFIDEAMYHALAPSLASFSAQPTPPPTRRGITSLLERVENVSIASAEYTITILDALQKDILAISLHSRTHT